MMSNSSLTCTRGPVRRVRARAAVRSERERRATALCSGYGSLFSGCLVSGVQPDRTPDTAGQAEVVVLSVVSGGTPRCPVVDAGERYERRKFLLSPTVTHTRRSANRADFFRTTRTKCNTNGPSGS